MTTNKKRLKHIQSIREWLELNDWKQNSYGHHETIIGKMKYRMKFQKNSIRLEKRCQMTGYGEKKTFKWIKLTNDYFSKIFINENNQLVIGSKKIKPIKS